MRLRSARLRRAGIAGALAATMLLAPTTVVAVQAASMPAAEPNRPSTDTVPSKEQVKKAREQAAAAAGSVAQAQRELADAAAALQRLGSRLAIASEQYNAALYQLEQAKQKARVAAESLAQAEIIEQAADAELASFAAAAYRSGGDIARVSAMLSADGPQALLDQASTMTVLGDRQAAVLARVQAARAASVVLRDQAADALAEQQTAAAEVKRSKDAAQAAVEQQQAIADQLEVKRAALVSRLEGLKGRSEELARQRADGLARLAAERAAAEAALDDGTIAGDVPRGILLGMPAVAPEGSQRGTVEGARKAIAFARQQLGKPYLWGGTGPDRFDCSGLVLRAWEKGGVSFPHWSVAQYAAGRKIPLSSLRPGDLVFFSTDLAEYRAIVHVGLYIGEGKMIEAPYTGANVRIAPIQRKSLFGAVRP
jgi:peptidoglycan DL-endopeptidase CwlO